MDPKTRKKIIGTVVGAADPILKEWAQQFSKKIPEKSIFRSKIFGSVVGALKQYVEVLSEKLPPSLGVLIEKVIDFNDFFTGALGTEAKKVKREVNKEWMDKFFKDAGERLQKIEKKKDLKMMAEKIKLEFKLRLEILKHIEELSKLTEPTPTEKTEAGFSCKEFEDKFFKLISEFTKWWSESKIKQKVIQANKDVATAIKTTVNNPLEQLLIERRRKNDRKQVNYRR